MTDCQALYDGVVKSVLTGLGSDERETSIEALALRRDLEKGGNLVRWVHSHAQLADGMTKASLQAFHVLHSFLKRQRWKIVHDERFLSARKKSALGKGIFDETTEEDHADAKKLLETRRRNRQTPRAPATAETAADDVLEPTSYPLFDCDDDSVPIRCEGASSRHVRTTLQPFGLGSGWAGFHIQTAL